MGSTEERPSSVGLPLIPKTRACSSMVEPLPHKQKVPGSSPGGPTISQLEEYGTKHSGSHLRVVGSSAGRTQRFSR